LLALGVFVLLAGMASLWPAFRSVDGTLSAGIRAMRTPLGNAIAPWLTELGGLTLVVGGSLALVVWMAVRRNWAAVVYIVFTVGVGWFIGNNIIKNVIHRPRPSGVNIVPVPGDYSMPSAHTLAAFLFWATLCVIVMLNAPTGRHLKRWLAIGSAIVILAVGWSRVYLGVHWFGDVIAAFLFGGAWWTFCTATYFGAVTEERRTGAKLPEPPQADPS
jgi:undecaprenyl-diphosphatase